MDDISVKVCNVCKKFDIRHTTRYGGLAKNGVKTVLNNISFSAKKGQIIGVVGKNGSGKSTLLKIISGILVPDAGSVNIKGVVAGILELEMGFQPEQTGRDNIYIKCGMYGFNKKDVDKFISDIIDFSELGEQIDHPLRTYSSGMKAKLAFAVLIHIRCDVLVIDEVLSVGDIGFNMKCKAIFDKMKKQGKTIFMASHNLKTLEEICDRAIWIDDGKVKDDGDVFSICYKFQNNMVNSYDTVLQMAEIGDVVSQTRLGVMFRDGIGVAPDSSQAIKWFTTASKHGSSDAQFNLAELYLSTGDVKSALKYYELAANLNNPLAISKLHILKNDSSNYNLFENKLKELVDSGNLRATKLYADLLFNGNYILKNQKRAIEFYTKCANSGDVPSMFQLAMIYRDGIATEKDSVSSIYWFSEAARCGNNRARIELANMYRKGIGIDVDISKAIMWYECAANFGDTGAMLQLGMLYRDGLSIDKDNVKSEYWFNRYANHIQANSESSIADILKAGYSDEDCIFWYNAAANHGSTNALLNLGFCYRDGICTTSDSKIALSYFIEAGKKGNVPAMIECYLMLSRGNGCDQDSNAAFRWISVAASYGNSRARLELANSYLKGVGVDADANMAHNLYSIQSEYGDIYSKYMVQKLDSQKK